MANQCKCELNEEVIAIEKKEHYFIVKTKDKEYHAKMVINCAGLHADDINEMVTGTRDFEIIPRKGEYFVLNKNCNRFVKHVIYPTPSTKGKGVLVVPTVHGNVLLGPNACDQEDKQDHSTTQEGLDFIRHNINKIVKNVPYGEIIHSFSGLRPTCNRHDFIIEESRVKGFINVAGIESPGLASAPAIAERVLDKFIIPTLHPGKRMFFAHRSVNVRLDQCSDSEKQAHIQRDARFGRIVCRCEQVSEAEIVNCIHRKCGARSVMAVKKRVRPGMGKCQGGFCEPLVVKILARELNISPLEVDYNKKGSPILVSQSKAVK